MAECKALISTRAYIGLKNCGQCSLCRLRIPFSSFGIFNKYFFPGQGQSSAVKQVGESDGD